jgi:NAD(P)-dependent dehydrogenase (short-subunit alcohol dehydrogenase family)
VPASTSSSTLREGLLGGVALLLAGASGEGAAVGVREAVRDAFGELGANVYELELLADGEPVEAKEIDRRVQRVVADHGGIDVLLVDGAGSFAAAGAGASGLGACLQATWSVTRAAATCAFIAAGSGGRIGYVTPAPDAGPHADAARAGLENLARTLSIEWARHQITPVAIAPGEETAAAEVAAVCAYLASAAGAYFSGCLLDLRGLGER